MERRKELFADVLFYSFGLLVFYDATEINKNKISDTNGWQYLQRYKVS